MLMLNSPLEIKERKPRKALFVDKKGKLYMDKDDLSNRTNGMESKQKIEINLSNLINQTYNKEMFLEICQQVLQSDGAMEVVSANIASGMTKEKYDNMLAYLTAYNRTTQELKTA